MTVIDSVFCLRMGAVIAVYTDPSHVSVVTFDWSEIMDSFNAPCRHCSER